MPRVVKVEHDDLADAVASLVGRAADGHWRITALEGGRNNRVYRADGPDQRLLVKTYFRTPHDKRDRYAAENAFYSFLEHAGARQVPRALGWDAERRMGVFTFVDGRRLDASELDAAAIDGALRFFADINRERGSAAAQRLGDASEACFSIAAHLDTVGRRVERMGGIEESDSIAASAAAFVRTKLRTAWDAVRRSAEAAGRRSGLALERELTRGERCISPSDFGFHNVVRGADGALVFFDFEYAGWDDPGKLTADFFCQQQRPVSPRFWDHVVAAVGRELGEPAEYRERAALLYPVYQVKWCCIILNEFLATESARRDYAGQWAGSAGRADTRARQLAAAERFLATLAPATS